ncbi:unnamed protein product [Protopolystoma xenopodis]|uniref:Uncharacterized protein n=1 Tax=Protopolystoma xenopodis TaxID=117903 RepID=A0A448WSX9_9PLAT|nr:unnamed protein product [Protopolystoma xenopodis]
MITPGTPLMFNTETHLSGGHLFIFKTLITLSVLHFVVNLPGYLYAQVILPQMAESWHSTSKGRLLYDCLFLATFTNNGIRFFVLLVTVHGFRRRVSANLTRWITRYCDCGSGAGNTGRRINGSQESLTRPTKSLYQSNDLQLLPVTDTMVHQQSCASVQVPLLLRTRLSFKRSLADFMHRTRSISRPEKEAVTVCQGKDFTSSAANNYAF